MFEVIKNNTNNCFYHVDSHMIKFSESNMGVSIPKALILLYNEVGYGFLETTIHNINRIMGPNSIEEFRLGTGQFANIDDSDFYNQFASDKLIFFEVHDSLFISIGISKNNLGKIFYYDKIIANDLEDFFALYTNNERYFLE